MPDHGDTEAAVRRDLRAFPLKARRSALATAAITLARRIDQGNVTPPELAALTRELRAALADLAKAQPPQREQDRVDDLAGRRADRRAQRG